MISGLKKSKYMRLAYTVCIIHSQLKDIKAKPVADTSMIMPIQWTTTTGKNLHCSVEGALSQRQQILLEQY